MAILDEDEKLSDDQAVTVSVASDNIIDLGPVHSNQGDCSVCFRVGTAFTAAGAATLALTLEHSADKVTWVNIGSAGAPIAVAALVVGYQENIKVPHQRAGVGLLKYVRAYYTVATGPMLTGKISAFVQLNPASKGA
jgi:hypothetical protein